MLATTIHKSNTTPHHQSRATTTPPPPSKPGKQRPAPFLHREQSAGLLSQSPIVCLAVPHRRPITRPPIPAHRLFHSCTRPPPTTGDGHRHESPRSPNPHTTRAGHRSRGAP